MTDHTLARLSLSPAAPLPGRAPLAIPRPDRGVIGLGAMAVLLVAALAIGKTAPTTAGLALAGLCLLVTLVVLVFARRQLRADPRQRSFARLASGMALATLLMALTGDALLLAVGWIASGRLMVGLIGHIDGWDEARAATRRANIAFTVGDLALVGGVLLLAVPAGTTDLAAIAAAVPTMGAASLATAAMLLVVAMLARCAVPPFSGWLLASLAAPTPVSALMHAGFVNAGGFLLIRFAPVIEAAPMARAALFAAGVIAALIGSAIMLVRSDVKGALAASTVAQMGFMLLTLALGAYAAALWHMIAHGVFKAWLFLGSSGTVSSLRSANKGIISPYPALIALAALAGAGALMNTSHADALLPVGLALTALLSALAIAVRGTARSPRGLAVLVLAAPVALIATNAAALAMMGTLQTNAAVPLLPVYAQFGLLSLLLAGWVWQQRVATGEAALHPALLARLLHAGAARTASASAPSTPRN